MPASAKRSTTRSSAETSAPIIALVRTTVERF